MGFDSDNNACPGVGAGEISKRSYQHVHQPVPAWQYALRRFDRPHRSDLPPGRTHAGRHILVGTWLYSYCAVGQQLLVDFNFHYTGFGVVSFGDRNGILSLPVSSFYRVFDSRFVSRKAEFCLFLTSVGATGLWIEYTLSQIWRESRHFDFYPEHVAVSAALFILIYSLSHFLDAKENGKIKDYGALLAIWSLRFGLVLMLVRSFSWSWEYLISEGWNHLHSTFIIVLVFLGLSVGLIWKSYRILPLLGFILLFALSLITAIVSSNEDHSLYLQILFNTSLIGMGIWMILRGINSGISRYFFLGIATILTTAFVRYIDLIGNYVGGAVLFAFFSVLLLGAAYYWKKHPNRGDTA